MMSVTVIPDRFKGIQEDLAAADSFIRPKMTVRRPVRGISVKDDTYATMRVVTGDGKAILLTDAAGKHGTQTNRKTAAYSNFLLQQVSEERAEKQQILETFGEPYIFLFGERARIITFAGVLLNTFDFNWEAEWWHNYETYLRGTRCVENDARVFISYDENLVSGYIIGSSSTKSTQDPNYVQFQFTLFLTGYSNFSDIGDGTAVPMRARERANRIQIGDSVAFTIQKPTPLTPGQAQNPASNSLTGGAINQPSLVDGLTAGLQTVVTTWRSAQQLVNNATQTISNLARGEIMRVPTGFAGAFSYGDPVKVQTTASNVTPYGTIKYTEFKDNADEFVGSSSFYGATGNLLPSAEAIALQSQERNQAFVEQAKEEWARNGFELPSDNEAAVASFMLKGTYGMISAGNTSLWQAAESANTALTVVNTSPVTAARAVSPVPIPG